MMNRIGFRSACWRWILLSVFGLMLAGCAGSSQPATFYMLRSLDSHPGAISTTAGEQRLSVLVGPITLPGYLARTQIIMVAGKNEMAVDEFNRWAESLQESFYRVLRENLSSLLNTPEVYGHDRSGSISADYQVVIDVTRFDSVQGEEALLTAFWTVSGKDASAPSIRRKSTFRFPVSVSGLPGIIDAQNQTLNAFSREIASAIQSLQR